MRQSSRAVLRQRSTKTVFPGIGPDTLEKFHARARLLAARDGKPYLRTPSASRRLCIAISVFGRTWTYDAPGCQVSCETNRRARQIRFPCPSAYAQAFKLTGYHLANRNRDTRLLRRHLALALQVMESWGFRYSAVAFTWVKLNKGDPAFWLSERDFFMGQGHTTRKNAEFCLLRRRGLRSASAGISGSLLLRQDESIAASPTRPTSASSGMRLALPVRLRFWVRQGFDSRPELIDQHPAVADLVPLFDIRKSIPQCQEPFAAERRGVQFLFRHNGNFAVIDCGWRLTAQRDSVIADDVDAHGWTPDWPRRPLPPVTHTHALFADQSQSILG
jgi:hypothetical protein